MLLISNLVAAQSYTLYYSDIEVVNPDTSVTVTPTVSISGWDGGYCDPFNGFTGYEYPLVMLSGNPWQVGPEYESSGGMGTYISYPHTFSSVTVQPGQVADLSFAGKVQGVCKYSSGTFTEPSILPFYTSSFVDGSGPNISPGPCWISGFLGQPACPAYWPYIFTLTPAGWHPSDLGSQQVGQLFRISTTYWGPPVTRINDLCYWGSLACSAGTTATCTHGYGLTFAPACPDYVKAEWLVVNGACVPVPYVQAASGAGPCD